MPDAVRQPKPPVLVLYNENPAWPQSDIDWSHEVLDEMTAGLREQGYPFETLCFFDDLSPLDRYDPRQWLIWNWGEELAGRPWSDSNVAAEMERRGFTFTGSPSAVLRGTQSRLAVKQRLQAAGLPTLPARVFTSAAQASEWQVFPAIVKGANQHASYGIGRESVVENHAELVRRIDYLRDHFHDDALVEAFLDSREFHVAVWGNAQPEALPPLELGYAAFDDPHDRLYTYDWKFDRDSRGFKEISMVCPAPLDRPDWRARLEAISIGAYQALGLRDYGRLDLRMLGDEPQVLDVNCNPDLDVTSVLPISSKSLGLSFGQMVDRILTFAAERLPAAGLASVGAR
jgi:D-alanine-D-alanine ligase